MTHGRIAKWHVGDGAGGVGDAGSHSPPGSGQGGSGGPQPGPRPSRVSEYDILLTVDTDSLVEEAYRLDQFAGTVSLLVESQEEAHVAALLAAEGEEVEVGRPIAVLCEDPGDAAAVRAELLLRQPQPLEAAQTRPSSTAASGASAAQPLAPVPAAALAMHGSKGSKHASAGVGTEKGAARLSEAGRALMASVGNLYADLDAATGSAAGLVRTAPPPRLLEWQSYLADSSKSSSSSKCGCM
ncbi:hypothetical protein HYH02_012958 [Chlamydomonas schloesseri]|uniref:Lipoyl-binding domain-containing protein n=1 Tax=Chlamydomonas schloesseri TaxID=2026947 RepID=A0A835W194_9CHLO|nr:hypothetical protein HYH02_012958 [Chlamydomonas schloesseri]|eukprot:KAG2432386.1 hypothetical protein HYH02_012958 [Chlamydomonas schloesseri]